MIIVAGLGNPGKKFKDTRHNVGFMAVDLFAENNNFPEFKLQKKSGALVSEKDDILLVKPQTFMNDSGKSVKSLTSNSEVSNLVIVHDDIDLPVGKIKIVKERGSAGHKGVESIIKSIGNDGLIRFRIGIEPDLPAQAGNSVEAMKIVLKNFSEAEKEKIDYAIKKASDALSLFIKEGLDKTMNEFNG